MKDRLLDIAIEKFGRHGFDGVGTRAIAEEAGTAMSAITYHYGGKRGLYRAAAKHIAEQMYENFAPAIASMPDPDDCSRDAAVDWCVELVKTFAAIMLREESEAWSLFITREQQSPTEAFASIAETGMAPVAMPFMRYIAVARPDLDREAVALTALFVLGQALMLRTGRATMHLILQTDAITPRLTALIDRQLEDNVRRILASEA